ncbi:large ribosomal subunit protein mL50 isoform X2 [Lissotriton helveticus]
MMSAGLLRMVAVAGGCRRALWDGFRKKTADPEVVRVTGHLELASSQAEPASVGPPPRSRKYSPPPDLEKLLEANVRKVFGVSADWQRVSLENGLQKFHLLAGLASELGHAVPNSQLREMQTIADLLAFYRTPVKEASKFDELVAADLPANLKIEWGY